MSDQLKSVSLSANDNCFDPITGDCFLMHYLLRICLAFAICVHGGGVLAQDNKQVLHAGIVGCDTSHVIVYTNLMNDPGATGAMAQVQITCAYPGGSNDMPLSRDRVDGFAKELKEKGITIVESIDELVEQSDVIMLESVDGRVHLQQFRAVAKGKPVFIDKPIAASLADTIAIFQHARQTDTPVFSSSALRFCDSVQELAGLQNAGKVSGCNTTGPMAYEPHHPDLFWYGIHGLEALFAILGPGCKEIARIDSDSSTLVVGRWSDGRIGSYRGLKQGKSKYAFSVFGEDRIEDRSDFSGYEPMAQKICEFFVSRKPPVSPHETIEIVACMEAADESLRNNGKLVAVDELIRPLLQSVSDGAMAIPE